MREEAGRTRTHLDPLLRLAEGTVLAGRYNVVELLGVGGMGIVYRARDEQLGIEVAVKVLRPELAGATNLLERFRQELILARQVSHRNVVRIHDIGQDGDLWFLTMDLVAGRSLRELLDERGRLAPEEATAIARQLAQALAEAHRQGVVHRDLKPSNVLIGPTGQAYVTDFGVARSVSAAGLTRTGAVVGTPDYLSPEQAEGKAVDARSDLYALGVILFEMLSGRLPFAGGSVAEAIAQRLAGTPRDLKDLGVEVPPALRAALRRCLERRPDRRFGSAEELAAALEVEPPAGGRRLRSWGAAAGAVVVLAAAAIAAQWLRSRPPAPAGPRPAGLPAETLVILPFADETGRSDLAWLARGVPEMLAMTLGETPALTVVDPARVERALTDLRLGPPPWDQPELEQIGSLFEAERLAFGRIRALGGRLSLEARLLLRSPPASPRVEALPNAEAPLEQPALLVAALADGMRGRLAVRPGREVEWSADPQALAAYTAAGEMLRRGEAVAARPLLEEAVARDPAFAAAWLRLSEAADALGLGEPAQAAAERAEQALADPSSRLAYRVRAQRVLLAGDPATAREIRRELVSRYPNDLEAAVALGEAYGEEGRFPEAMATLEKVVGTDPSHPRAWFLLGKYAILGGDAARAADELLVRALVIQNRLRNRQGQADVLNAFGIAYNQLGDLDQAAENYRRAGDLRREIGDTRGQASTLRNLAQIDLRRGRYDAAQESLEHALALREELGDAAGIAGLRNDLGLVEEGRGRYADALRHYRAALASRRELGDLRAVAEGLNNVGYAYYLLGEYDNAAVYWREAMTLYRDTSNAEGEILVLQSLAQLQLARGQWDAAARAYLDALERSRRSEFRPAVAVSAGYLGRLAQYQGRFAAALASYDEALAVLAELEDPRGLAEFTLARAETLLDLGEFEAAAVDLERAAQWLEASANHEQKAELLRLRGLLELAHGGAGAAKTLRAAAAEAAATQSVVGPLAVELALGVERLTAGDVTAAAEAAATAGERAAALGHVLLTLRGLELAARAALCRGEPAAALAAARQGLREASRVGTYAFAFRLHAAAAAAERAQGLLGEAAESERRAEQERRRIESELSPAQRQAFARVAAEAA